MIKIIKTNKTDTVYFTIFIKGDKLRVEELKKGYKYGRYLIINKKDLEAFILKKDKKIYTKISAHDYLLDLDTNITLIKTKNYKYLLGHKCYQWRLKIPDSDTEITYWVTVDNYDAFYYPIALFHNDYESKYFLKIKGNYDVFPMLIVERSLLRAWKSEIKVIEIKDKKISNQLFEIPNDYEFYKK